MQIENWKEVKNFEGKYWVSNFGNVKNDKKLLKPMTAKTQPYKKYGLFNKGLVRYVLGHRLVAEHFLENPNNYPLVHHKDNDKLNNNVGNLEWCTHSQNTKYAIEDGRFKQIFTKDKNPVKRFNEYHIKAIRDLATLDWSITDINEIFDCSRGHISEIINHKKR